MEGNGSQLRNDTSTNPKFTAVRLDVRQLVQHQRTQVVVITDRTTGLDVKKMVAEKNGIGQQFTEKMNLIASTQGSADDTSSNRSVKDAECMLVVLAPSAAYTVRFSMKWIDGFEGVQDFSKTKKRSSSLVTRSNTIGHTTIKTGIVSGTTRAELSQQVTRRIEQHSTKGTTLPRYIKRDSNPETNFSDVIHPVRNVGSIVRRNTMDTKREEFLIQYEPHQRLQRIVSGQIGQVRRVVTNDRRVVTDDRSSTSSDGTTISPRLCNMLRREISCASSRKLDKSTNNTSEKEETSEKKVLNYLGQPKTDHGFNRSEPNSKHGDKCIVNGTTRGELGRGGTSAFQPICSTSLSEKSESVQTESQRGAKFSSLPNMEQLSVSARRGSEVAEVQPVSSSSMPCISSVTDGATTSGRRFLPRLCIPEAIVEEKRNLLSKKLERKLSRVIGTSRSQKKRNGEDISHRKRTDASAFPERNLDCAGLPSRKGHPRKDSDCVSVTSWEVAEILATAEPMAPQHSDYEDSASSSEDEFIHKFTSVFHPHNKTLSFSETKKADGLDSEKKFTPIENHKCNGIGVRSEKKPEPDVSALTDSKSNLTSSLKLHRTVSNDAFTKHSVPLSKQPSQGPSIKSPSLFRLLRNGNYRFRTATIARLKTLPSNCDRLPLEIFNDVIFIDDATSREKNNGKTFKERFTVPVVGDIMDSQDWECLEGKIEIGDIIVEVNGERMMNLSAAAVAKMFMDFSECLQIALARPRTSLKS